MLKVRQKFTESFSVQCCLESHRLHWTGFLPVQCCPKSSIVTTLNWIFSCTILLKVFTCAVLGIKTTLNRISSCAVFWSLLDNIDNLTTNWQLVWRKWPTQYCVNHAYEYCLVNVVQKHLRQHSTRKLLAQCWLRAPYILLQETGCFNWLSVGLFFLTVF